MALHAGGMSPVMWPRTLPPIPSVKRIKLAIKWFPKQAPALASIQAGDVLLKNGMYLSKDWRRYRERHRETHTHTHTERQREREREGEIV
jgi:hypothetical protein